MEPGMSEEQRRWTWQPGMPVAAHTVALAAGWAALVMLGALAIGTSELHHWEQAIALALLGVSLAGVFVARSRADAEAQDHWNLLAVAFAASGLAQLFVIVGQSRINEHQLPSITDVAFLLFQVLVAGFFLRYVNTGNRVHLATHLFDALLLATALTFLLWELVLRHDLGELSRLSGTTQVLVVLDPFLDFLVFSLVVLLLLVDRSPVRVMSLLGATALAAGDVVTGGGVNVERGRLVIGGLCWILGGDRGGVAGRASGRATASDTHPIGRGARHSDRRAVGGHLEVRAARPAAHRGHRGHRSAHRSVLDLDADRLASRVQRLGQPPQWLDRRTATDTGRTARTPRRSAGSRGGAGPGRSYP
jgi:hypothetical protein